jgi:hypothetical protein
MTRGKASTTAKTTAAQRKRVREVIAKVRAAFPNLPLRIRKPGEDHDVAAIEELGDLLGEMLKFASPEQRAEFGRQMAMSVASLRLQLEAETRAGSPTAPRMLAELFADVAICGC